MNIYIYIYTHISLVLMCCTSGLLHLMVEALLLRTFGIQTVTDESPTSDETLLFIIDASKINNTSHTCCNIDASKIKQMGPVKMQRTT